MSEQRKSSGGWTIGQKIMLAFGLLAIVLVALGGLGYYSIIRSKASLDEISAVRLPSVHWLLVASEAHTALNGSENALLSMELTPEQREEHLSRIESAHRRAKSGFDAYAPLPQTEEEAGVYQEFLPAWDDWMSNHVALMEAIKAFQSTGIHAPKLVEAKLESFRHDHSSLLLSTWKSISANAPEQSSEVECTFPEWVDQFESSVEAVDTLVQSGKLPHEHFHASLNAAVSQFRNGDEEGAKVTLLTQAEAANDEFLKYLDTVGSTVAQSATLLAQANAQAEGGVQLPSNVLMSSLTA